MSKFAYSGVDNVYALWALSTVPKGGLDWSTKEIGQVGGRYGPFIHTYVSCGNLRGLLSLHSWHYLVIVCPLTLVLLSSAVLSGYRLSLRSPATGAPDERASGLRL